MNTRGLRWHVWVRTRNGHIESYCKVRAWSLSDAVVMGQAKIYKRNKKDHPQYKLKDCIVIGVSLDSRDKNNIDDRKWD